MPLRDATTRSRAASHLSAPCAEHKFPKRSGENPVRRRWERGMVSPFRSGCPLPFRRTNPRPAEGRPSNGRTPYTNAKPRRQAHSQQPRQAHSTRYSLTTPGLYSTRTSAAHSQYDRTGSGFELNRSAKGTRQSRSGAGCIRRAGGGTPVAFDTAERRRGRGRHLHAQRRRALAPIQGVHRGRARDTDASSSSQMPAGNHRQCGRTTEHQIEGPGIPKLSTRCAAAGAGAGGRGRGWAWAGGRVWSSTRP